MLSSERLQGLREAITTHAFELGDGRTLDLSEIFEFARRLNPCMEQFGENLLSRASGRRGLVVLNTISEALFLPHGELLTFGLAGRGKPEMISAQVIGETWREWPLVWCHTVWSADIRAHEESCGPSGFSFGDCAFVEAGRARADARAFFSVLSQSNWELNEFYAELGRCFRAGIFSAEEYERYFGEDRARYKYVQQARDTTLAVERKSCLRVKGDPAQIADTLVFENAPLKQHLAGAPLDEVELWAWECLDLSAGLGGAVWEIKEHLANRREGLAYCAFLDYMGKVWSLAAETDTPANLQQAIELHTARAHREIFEEHLGVKDILSTVKSSPDGPAAALKLMNSAYNVNFTPTIDRWEWIIFPDT